MHNDARLSRFSRFAVAGLALAVCLALGAAALADPPSPKNRGTLAPYPSGAVQTPAVFLSPSDGGEVARINSDGTTTVQPPANLALSSLDAGAVFVRGVPVGSVAGDGTFAQRIERGAFVAGPDGGTITDATFTKPYADTPACFCSADTGTQPTRCASPDQIVMRETGVTPGASVRWLCIGRGP